MLMPSIFGENLFDDFMNDFPFFDDKEMRNTEKRLYGHHAKQLMKTDIKENEKEYTLEMDLPGFKKEEITVSLEHGYLTVGAKKGIEKEENGNKEEKYIRKERYCGSCERTFYVGEAVTQSDIKGEFKHGILTLLIPKKDPKSVEEKTYITIEG